TAGAMPAYFGLRGAPESFQTAALVSAAGLLTLAAVEDIFEEAHESREDTKYSTPAFPVAFVLRTLVSVGPESIVEGAATTGTRRTAAGSSRGATPRGRSLLSAAHDLDIHAEGFFHDQPLSRRMRMAPFRTTSAITAATTRSGTFDPVSPTRPAA